MIKSLRWQLQMWHALLLMIVLIIFGGVVYALQWQTRLQQTDAELDRVALVLVSRIRGLFPVPRMPNPGTWPSRSGGRGGQRSSDGRADEQPVADALSPANVFPNPSSPDRGSSRDEGRGNRNGQRFTGREDNREISRDASRSPAASEPRDGSLESRSTNSRTGEARPGEARTSEGRSGETRPPDFRSVDPRDVARDNPWFSPPPGLGLPDEFKHLFDGDGENSFYFSIWDRTGNLLEKSKSVSDIPFPQLEPPKDEIPMRVDRMRDLSREVIHVTRGRNYVLVGRSIKPDLAALHRSGLRLVFTGLGVLVLGLAGGWWFSSRAIRPISEMSATAESISVRNLSSRINTQSTAAELEQLATVLNHTFDRLQSAFERQSQFTADASHELRTPLSVILSHAELALSRPRSNEEYQKAFQACRRASLRMKTLIDSLLLLARFDAGHTEVERRPVDLDRLAADAVEMVQPLADEKQIELQCRADSIVVAADAERLFQVFTNLLSNGIRYNKAGGRVELEITSDEQDVIIRVADTGVGISPNDLPRIFDRFYRVDKARTTAEGGCGLGLAICTSIIEAHGGRISAQSQIDVGTTVEVRLPLACADHSSSSEIPASEPLVAG